jgi:tetratricopeptide (TPR) repeat protein
VGWPGGIVVRSVYSKAVFLGVIGLLVLVVGLALAPLIKPPGKKRPELGGSTNFVGTLGLAGGVSSGGADATSKSMGGGGGVAAAAAQRVGARAGFDSGSASNAFKHARSLFDERRYGEALAVMDELLVGGMPKELLATVQIERARILLNLGERQKALEIYSGLLVSNDDRVVFHEALAKFYILHRDAGSLEQQISKREEELRDAPGNIRSMEVLAGLYQYANDPTGELRVRRMLGTGDGTTDNLARLFQLYSTAGETASACQVLGKLAETDAEHRSVWLLKKAETEAGSDNPKAALATCDQALAVSEMPQGLRFRIAHVLADLKENRRALSVYSDLEAKAKTEEMRQRYALEGYRMRLLIDGGGAEVKQGLERLASESPVDYVRKSASNLLGQFKAEGHL